MAYRVALLNFEGPLDLLLQLVQQTRLAVSEVSLAMITEQYLGYARELVAVDPFEASQFAEIAAKLLYIKSAGLINQDNDEEGEREIAELQEQLERYGAYKQAADQLAARWATPQRAHARQRTGQPNPISPPRNLTAAALQRALGAVRGRHIARQRTHHIAPVTVSLAQMRQRWHQAAHNRTPSLQAFFSELDGRLEVTVAFVTALELWRGGELALSQTGQFTTIEVAYADPAATA